MPVPYHKRHIYFQGSNEVTEVILRISLSLWLNTHHSYLITFHHFHLQYTPQNTKDKRPTTNHLLTH